MFRWFRRLFYGQQLSGAQHESDSVHVIRGQTQQQLGSAAAGGQQEDSLPKPAFAVDG